MDKIVFLHPVKSENSAEDENLLVTDSKGKWCFYNSLAEGETFTPYNLYITELADVKDDVPFLLLQKFTNEWKLIVVEGDFGKRIYDLIAKEYKEPVIATDNVKLHNLVSAYKAGGGPIEYLPNPVGRIPKSLIEHFIEKQGDVKEVILQYTFDVVKHSVTHHARENYRPKLNRRGEIIWKSADVPVQMSRDELRTKVLAAIEHGKSIMAYYQLNGFGGAPLTPDAWFNQNFPT
jgi:hypothetical protein